MLYPRQHTNPIAVGQLKSHRTNYCIEKSFKNPFKNTQKLGAHQLHCTSRGHGCVQQYTLVGHGHRLPSIHSPLFFSSPGIRTATPSYYHPITKHEKPHFTLWPVRCVLWFYDGLIVYIISFMQELCPKFKERFIWKFVLDHNRWNEKRRCLCSVRCKFPNRRYSRHLTPGRSGQKSGGGANGSAAYEWTGVVCVRWVCVRRVVVVVMLSPSIGENVSNLRL